MPPPAENTTETPPGSNPEIDLLMANILLKIQKRLTYMMPKVADYKVVPGYSRETKFTDQTNKKGRRSKIKKKG